MNFNRIKSEKGQAILEMTLILPFFILFLMVLGEFGIYFYRSNNIENTAQTVSRMIARNANFEPVNTYINNHIGSLNTQLKILNEDGQEISSWSSDEKVEVRIISEVKPVLPVQILNIFSPEKKIFPDKFRITARKYIYVE